MQYQTNPHILNLLNDVKTMLKSMTNKKLPCLDGWLLDINVLYLLWDDLHSNHNVKYFITNILNQDRAENLFFCYQGKEWMWEST